MYTGGMTKEQLIKLAGSQAELARLLKISRAAVCNWKEIPKLRVYQLRVLRPEWFEVIE
jgi:biotin operon repressor